MCTHTQTIYVPVDDPMGVQVFKGESNFSQVKTVEKHIPILIPCQTDIESDNVLASTHVELNVINSQSTLPLFF